MTVPQSDADWLDKAAWRVKRKRGRPPRAGTTATEVVTIRLTSDEHRSWRRASVGLPLSEWIRRLANKAAAEDV